MRCAKSSVPATDIWKNAVCGEDRCSNVRIPVPARIAYHQILVHGALFCAGCNAVYCAVFFDAVLLFQLFTGWPVLFREKLVPVVDKGFWHESPSASFFLYLTSDLLRRGLKGAIEATCCCISFLS